MDGSPSSLRAVLVLTVMMSLLSVTVSEGQVTTPIKPSGLPPCPTCSGGPTVVIPSGSSSYIIGGMRNGANLFHSFSEFSVAQGNTAAFQNQPPTMQVVPDKTVSNIIGRVTGANPSNIYGTVNTQTGFPSSNLFLINPQGIVVGPNAHFNVGGSLHLSTADYLRLGSGNDRFYVVDLGKTSQLTSAAVTAFGFLNSNPAAIAVKGSKLAVPTGQTLSLVGGNRTFPDPDNSSVNVPAGVTMRGGSLSTPGGRINIVSVASAGEVSLNISNGPFAQPTFVGFTDFGRVALSQGASVDTSTNQSLNTPVAAGPIYIRGGQLELDTASLKAISRGYDLGGDPAINPIANVEGGDIIVTAERVTLNQSTIQTGSAAPSPEVYTRMTGVIARIPDFPFRLELTPGSIKFNVGNLLVKDSRLDVSSNIDAGRPGSLRIDGLTGLGSEASSVTLQNSMVLASPGRQALFSQPVGDIEIHSNNVLIDGLTYSGVTSDGKGGDLKIQSSGRIDMQNTNFLSWSFVGLGGVIDLNAGKEISLLSTTLESRSSIGFGAGDVALTAPVITMHGGGIITDSQGSLHAGNISFSVGTLNISALRTDSTVQSAVISSSASQGGSMKTVQAGTITVQGIAEKGTPAPPATHVILDNTTFATTTNSQNSASIHPATISITAQNIELTNGAQVKADTSGAAPAGNIALNAEGAITLTNGARIASTSTGISGTLTIPERAGLAGDITLTSGHNTLIANSTVTTSAADASGGNITLTSPHVVQLVGATLSSDVKGQVQFVNGKPVVPKGGDITIDTVHPQAVVIQGNSLIRANAPEGQGGNINIIAGVVLQETGSVLDASSGIGLSGTINIQAPIQQLSGAIAPLPQAFAVATNLYGQRCAAEKGGQFSSFVQGARDGVPPQPGDLIPSPMLLESDGASASLSSQSSPNLAAIRLGLPDFDHASPVTFASFAGCRS